jgi:hypothetical protein
LAGVGAIVLADFGQLDEAMAVAEASLMPVERRGESWVATWVAYAEVLALTSRDPPLNCEAHGARFGGAADWVSTGMGRATARMSAALAAPNDRAVIDAVFDDLEGMAQALLMFSTVSTVLWAFLAHLELLRDRPAEALARAERGLRDFPTGTIGPRSLLRLARVRALTALGHRPRAARRGARRARRGPRPHRAHRVRDRTRGRPSRVPRAPDERADARSRPLIRTPKFG